MKINVLRCREKCLCKQEKCLASDLTQCSICKNVLRSVCSKANCRVNGQKPVMILPLKAIPTAPRKLFAEQEDSENESENDDESGSDSDGCSTDVSINLESDSIDAMEDEEAEEGNEENEAINYLVKVWKNIQLKHSTQEEEIVGKWYAVCYQTKRCVNLFIGKILQIFLCENGQIDQIEVRCLKQKIGQETILEDTPFQHFPDIGLFKLEDIIAGPIEAVPLKGNKFDVSRYEFIKEHF